jgi:glycosyltransferase involved in cell wall biosynthesis
MKIAIYSICKNEEQHVEDFIKTVKDFDEVVVVDTGSTDNTVNLLRASGINVHVFPMHQEEFDFSKVRNLSKSLLSDDVDWCGFLDFNERFENYNKIWFEDLSSTSVIFERYDDFGNGDIRRGLEDHIRFIKKDLYEWKHAVHEDVFPITDNHTTSVLPIKVIKKIIRTEDKEKFYVHICERELEIDPSQLHYFWFVIKYYYQKQNADKVLKYGMQFLIISENFSVGFRPIVSAYCAVAALDKKETQLAISLLLSALSEVILLPDSNSDVARIAIGISTQIGSVLEFPEIALLATSFTRDAESANIRKIILNNLIKHEVNNNVENA